jgi:hypothetical protein
MAEMLVPIAFVLGVEVLASVGIVVTIPCETLRFSIPESPMIVSPKRSASELRLAGTAFGLELASSNASRETP